MNEKALRNVVFWVFVIFCSMWLLNLLAFPNRISIVLFDVANKTKLAFPNGQTHFDSFFSNGLGNICIEAFEIVVNKGIVLK